MVLVTGILIGGSADFVTPRASLKRKSSALAVLHIKNKTTLNKQCRFGLICWKMIAECVVQMKCV